MLMIVAHHYVVHGGFEPALLSPLSNAILRVIGSGGKLGVNIFVLISGYFLAGKEFSMKRIVKLLMQVTFYSVVLYALSVFLGTSSLKKKYAFYSAFVFLYDETYWFALTYFVLLLASPLINAGLRTISQQALLMLIVVFFVLWCLIPSCSELMRFAIGIGKLRTYDYSILGWFIWLYSMGAYVRKVKMLVCGRIYLTLTAMVCMIYAVALFADEYRIQTYDVNTRLGFLQTILKTLSYSAQNSIMPCIIAVLLFLSFAELEIPYNRIINIVGGCNFWCLPYP